MSVVTIFWIGSLSGKELSHWSFDAAGEDMFVKLDPLKVFPRVDSSQEWPGRKGMYRGLNARRKGNNNLPVNRTQKGIELCR